MRVIFTFFVVGIHTTPSDLEVQGSPLFAISILLDAIYRTAVPGFFLLTGFLLLHNAEQSLQFYRNRFSRILPAWILWSLIYLAHRVVFFGQQISIPSAVRCIISGDTYYHLWFMYRMAGVYLALPVIALLMAPASAKTALGAVGMAFAVNQLAPDAGRLATFLTGRNFQPGISYPLGDSLLLFAIAGGLLRSLTIGRFLRITSIAMFLCTYAALAMFSLWHSFRLGCLDDSVYVESLTTPMSLAFFVAAIHLLPGRTLPPALRAASDASFGTYLAHPLIFEILLKLPRTPFSDVIPGWNTTVVFFTSVVVVHLIRCIKPLRVLT